MGLNPDESSFHEHFQFTNSRLKINTRTKKKKKGYLTPFLILLPEIHMSSCVNINDQKGLWREPTESAFCVHHACMEVRVNLQKSILSSDCGSQGRHSGH